MKRRFSRSKVYARHETEQKSKNGYRCPDTANLKAKKDGVELYKASLRRTRMEVKKGIDGVLKARKREKEKVIVKMKI